MSRTTAPRLSFPGRRPLRAPLLFITLSVCLLPDALYATDLPGTAFNAWQGRQTSQSLDDGSVLNRYSSATTSTGAGTAEFRVEFMPRFECSPMFVVERDQARMPQPLADDDLIQVTIDGEPVVFPVLVDVDGARQRIYFNGNRQNRELLRSQIDDGNTLSWSLDGPLDDESTDQPAEGGDAPEKAAETAVIQFSLSGSSSSIAAVQERCQAHVPEPWSK